MVMPACRWWLLPASAATSSHAIPSSDRDLTPSFPQVRLSNPALTIKTGYHLKNALGHGAPQPSVLFKLKGSGSLLIAPGQLLFTQSREPLREAQQSPKANERFRERLSPAHVLQKSSHDSRDLPKPMTKRYSSLKSARQPAKGEAPEQRMNRQDSSVLRRQAHQETQPEAQRPFGTGRNSPPVVTSKAGKRSQPPRHRGTRNSSRGIDLLDDLMSTQGRSSKALLESLQSEVALAKDEMLNLRKDSAANVSADPYSSPNFPARKDVPQEQVEVRGIAGNPPGRGRPLQALFDTMSGTASTSGTFSSSIERALLPVAAAKSNHPVNNSSRNADSVQHGDRHLISENIPGARQPGLRGQEVLLAMQKAAIEKAKQKQKVRKPNEKAVKDRESMSLHDASGWQNAKPILLKPEWASQIDDLERRIKILKTPL